ncbi:ATP-binding protein [Tenacibaculum finnmarkense]|uniref:AAA family ATPase n=1 Tax=Tenacibaculum finnmarkense TaxID=2781243 RepID=UPI001EFA512B|nr:AAA family ATPase [Tenacibaculum finnmarkense]MCG8763514.1 ATP-binding protein [Tenacibaculum finnmarkense]MCG8788897.1 ATP-binding protein [Tenacibaculum finnmarkense]
MNEINIKLNQKYKSFDKDFNTILRGNIIILSGINGSGKSQLINIIKGREQRDINNFMDPTEHININSDVEINGITVDQKKIEVKSFKENINLPEIVKSTSTQATQAVDQAYNQFIKGNLDSDKLPQYASSCIRAIKILGDKLGVIDKNISESDFKNTLRQSDFTWRNEDQFTDIIGFLFFNHAMAIAQGRQKAGMKDGPAFDEASLGIAPWTELNTLFSDLKLEYRFKENYDIIHAELNETPCLYPIDKEGKISDSETRTLKDLSDGEKTIISLCFTSLRKIENEDKKLLLLDELDAVLNPSLIENLFVVLKKYYLDKGITILITTHSPATISLAPDNTFFYEVFKKNYSTSRIIEVDKDEYRELQKVNKRFYDKIDNQSQRINELESVLDSEEEILIITEGKTDWKYILGALKYFHSNEEFKNIEENFFYKYGSQSDVDNETCGTKIYADLGEDQLNKFLANEIALRTGDVLRRKKVWIGIFDSDTAIKIKSKPEYGVHSFKIEPDGISTEFLFNDNEIKTEIKEQRLFIGDEFDIRSTRHVTLNLNLGAGSQKKAGKRVIIDCDVYNQDIENKAISKEGFSQAIYNHEIEIENESWEKFRHIFTLIDSLLPKTETIEENK